MFNRVAYFQHCRRSQTAATVRIRFQTRLLCKATPDLEIERRRMEDVFEFQDSRRQSLFERELCDGFEDFPVGLETVCEGIGVERPSLFGRDQSEVKVDR